MQRSRQLLIGANSRRRNMSSSAPSSSASSITPSSMLRTQPRPTKLDHIISSIQGTFSILFDQKSRDSFVSRVNSGIINPNMIQHSNFALETYLPLSLHHDLNNPLWDVNKALDMEEFVEGVKPALENYEDVLTELECRDFVLTTTAANNDSDNSDDTISHDLGSLIRSLEHKQSIAGEDNSGDPDSNDDNNEDGKNEPVNWITVAKESPDSLEGQLYQMMDKESFEMLVNSARPIPPQSNSSNNTNVKEGEVRISFQEGSSEIQGVCISHARAIELPTDESNEAQSAAENGTTTEIMTDDSFESGIEKEHPVIAAINVIYIVKQTFLLTQTITNTAETEKDDEEKSTDEAASDDTASSKEGDETTSWAFRSAVFTSWLRNRDIIQGTNDIPIKWTLSGQATFPFPPDLTFRPIS